jgi:hypothetical protein
MLTPGFLRALVELSTCDSVDLLLADTVALLLRELRLRALVELWSDDDTRFVCGEPCHAAHTTWIGFDYTLGAIRLRATPPDPHAIELLACQLAPLAERLLDRELAQRRTIREDIVHLYERRIRDALIRHDWNASAVARELNVGRGRVAEVSRRWRVRSKQMFWNRTARVITSSNENNKVESHDDSLLRDSI